MKLDNIVYDIDSLRNAIIENWANDSPTFAAMYPSETSTALANVFAGYGAFLQYFIVSTMANCYTDTAFSREGIYQLAVTLGNVIHGNNSAQVITTVTKNNLVSMNITVPAETSFIINGRKYFNPHGILLPAGVETVKDIVLIQGEALEVTKTTSGIPYERFYFSTDFKANKNYVRAYVNGEEWSVSDNFLDYEKNYVSDPNLTKMLVLRTDSDGRSYLKLGNGQLGDLPVAGSTLLIHYVSNDGESGNTSEIGLDGKLENGLMFTDAYGNQEDLDLTVKTTSTSYGGFGTQSLETLRMTSPWVYASGHRAIRRQDYIAMLDNECGYLASNVWGEYEQSNMAGAYDSIMMNMVYYTGLKSFEVYPYSNIGYVSNNFNFTGSIGSNRGFYGSYSLKIANNIDPTKFVLMQDTGAKGFLFINDNGEDPRDSLLPEWQASLYSQCPYFIQLEPYNEIDTAGQDYKVGDIVLLENGLSVLVTDVNSTGAVTNLKLQQQILNTTDPNAWPGEGESRPCAAIPNQRYTKGTSLVVNITSVEKLTKTLVKTNDNPNNEPGFDGSSIKNIRSNVSSEHYYQSSKTPSLLQPVQIIIDYSDHIEGKGIVGVKFQATPSERFIGTFAMYATQEANPSYENIRNSEHWTRIIDKTYVEKPSSEMNYWTTWYPTNCLNGNKVEKYNIFVIEFYSTEQTASSSTNAKINIDKMKLLYEEDCSYINYANNGELNVNFPTRYSPGPKEVLYDDSEIQEDTGYLDNYLINEDDYLLYNYNVKANGITVENGYEDGNVLAYMYDKDGVKTIFLVKVMNIVNGVYTVTIRETESSEESTNLVGTQYIKTAGEMLLDKDVYRIGYQSIKFGNLGSGYSINDVVQLDGTNGQLKLKITATGTNGEVTQAIWLNNLLVNTDSITNDFIQENEQGTVTTSYIGEQGSGTGLTVNITITLASGNGQTPGQNGTISIDSNNNIEVVSSFVGNRIDNQDTNHLDQPIIEKYNHFTTYMEFVQPKVRQVPITINAFLSTSASITSNMIIQEIKNNVSKLFKITPDYIGKGLKLSDIYTAVMSTPNVQWCKVLDPVDNIEAEVDEFLISTYITVNEVIKEYK